MKRIIPVILILAIATTAFAQSTLSIQGNASLAVKPTQTTVNLNIESKSSTYTGAVEDMIKRVDQLTKDLKKIGFKDTDITTSNFNVDQSRVYVKNMWKDSGFVARQSLVVSFGQDKDQLIKVLNTVTKSAANPSINLSFGLDADRKESLKNELIKLAVRDAKTKAELIAQASGSKITGIKEIEYGKNTSGPMPMYEVSRNETMMKAADVQISNFEASDLKYNETISIVYTID